MNDSFWLVQSFVLVSSHWVTPLRRLRHRDTKASLFVISVFLCDLVSDCLSKFRVSIEIVQIQLFYYKSVISLSNFPFGKQYQNSMQYCSEPYFPTSLPEKS